MKIHEDQRDSKYTVTIEQDDRQADILENLLEYLLDAKIVDATDFYVKSWNVQWTHTDKDGKSYPF